MRSNCDVESRRRRRGESGHLAAQLSVRAPQFRRASSPARSSMNRVDVVHDHVAAGSDEEAFLEVGPGTKPSHATPSIFGATAVSDSVTRIGGSRRTRRGAGPPTARDDRRPCVEDSAGVVPGGAASPTPSRTAHRPVRPWVRTRRHARRPDHRTRHACRIRDRRRPRRRRRTGHRGVRALVGKAPVDRDTGCDERRERRRSGSQFTATIATPVTVPGPTRRIRA